MVGVDAGFVAAAMVHLVTNRNRPVPLLVRESVRANRTTAADRELAVSLDIPKPHPNPAPVAALVDLCQEVIGAREASRRCRDSTQRAATERVAVAAEAQVMTLAVTLGVVRPIASSE